jgi:hypothetical protein
VYRRGAVSMRFTRFAGSVTRCPTNTFWINDLRSSRGAGAKFAWVADQRLNSPGAPRMLKSKAIPTLSALALSAALALLAPAQAAVVVASFDPAFGAAIPNLGFRGTAQISVADSCFSLSGLVLNSDTCSGNSMSVLFADVEFYNINSMAVVGSATWAGNLFDVQAVFMQDGDLTGLDTTISLPESVTLLEGLGATEVNFSGYLSVQFYSGELTTGGGSGVLAPGTSDATVAGRGGVLMYRCDTPTGAAGAAAANECVSPQASNPALVSYTTVPEPATPALVALALAAAALGRRRAPQIRAS